MKMLMQKGTLCLYIPTETLENRADMESVEMTAAQIKAHNEKILSLRADAVAKATPPAVKRPYDGSHTTLKVGTVQDEPESKVVKIGTMTEAELRALAAEKNINLKNAKDVDKIRKIIMGVLIAPIPEVSASPATEPPAADEDLT